jgi:hypothetical protein
MTTMMRSRRGDIQSQQLSDSASHSVDDSLSRGVVFLLQISPRLRSKYRNGLKGRVRDS